MLADLLARSSKCKKNGVLMDLRRPIKPVFIQDVSQSEEENQAQVENGDVCSQVKKEGNSGAGTSGASSALASHVQRSKTVDFSPSLGAPSLENDHV
jgi:hypothetical protein